MRYVIMISLIMAIMLCMGCGKKAEYIENWVDLSAWKEVIYKYPANGQGRGAWELSNDNQWATQNINGDPAILVSDIDITGSTIEGSWLMKTNSDDDFVGFVFGYQDPGHFYLVDWKKGEQKYGGCGLAKQGISIKIANADYTGPEFGNLKASQPFDGEDLWNTEGSEGKVSLLFHEETEGWEFEKEYGFILKYDPDSFTITIKDGERNIFSKRIKDKTYKNGKFGFYNFSQAPVIYKGFKTITIIPAKSFPWLVLILVVVLFLLILWYIKRQRAK